MFNAVCQPTRKESWVCGNRPGELVLEIEKECEKEKAKKRKRNKKGKHKQSEDLLEEGSPELDEQERNLSNLLSRLSVGAEDTRLPCLVTEEWAERIAKRHLTSSR
jgi:hypothetical protein